MLFYLLGSREEVEIHLIVKSQAEKICFSNSCVVFQGLDLPNDLKELYKTVWEISQKTILKMAADRGAFIDQVKSCETILFKIS